MDVFIDTREHKNAIVDIQKAFDKAGVRYDFTKLYVGDYMSLDNARLVIDRKQDLLELCGNVCQQHERFKKELVRAMDMGISLIVLVEHGEDIKCMEDVYFWQNPRKHKVKYKTVDGKKVRYVESTKAVDGDQLYKSLCTIRDRYGVQFMFCTKEETGMRILRLLEGGA